MHHAPEPSRSRYSPLPALTHPAERALRVRSLQGRSGPRVRRVPPGKCPAARCPPPPLHAQHPSHTAPLQTVGTH
jgi:hypothetical protein